MAAPGVMHPTSERIALACPEDLARLELAADTSAYRCAACGRRYPLEQGVVRFLETRDAFYEGHYADWVPTRFTPKSEALWSAWPLWLMRNGYLWAVRKHVPAGSILLEVGCGSGVVYFGQRYRTIGLDLACTSLVKVVPLYELCMQADLAGKLPLPDASVDAIANSYLWEHLTPGTKASVLGEFARVLRPGGKLILLYDVDNANPLVRAMKKRDSALYRRLFIENEHHWGYQTADENRRLFEQSGFRVVEHRGRDMTWIQSPWVYDKVRHWDGWLRRLSSVGLCFTRPPWLYAWSGLVRVLDELVGPALPTSWAPKVLTVCERA